MPHLLTAAALFAVAMPLVAQSAIPDAIYYHGHILTGVELNQGKLDFVSAIAMRDGIITATGTDQALLATKGPKTQLVDLGGSFAMPGINDAHTHLADAGRLQLSVDLTGSKSLQEMLDRVGRAANIAPAGRWLQGGGWDHTLWSQKTLPTRQDLDEFRSSIPSQWIDLHEHAKVRPS